MPWHQPSGYLDCNIVPELSCNLKHRAGNCTWWHCDRVKLLRRRWLLVLLPHLHLLHLLLHLHLLLLLLLLLLDMLPLLLLLLLLLLLGYWLMHQLLLLLHRVDNVLLWWFILLRWLLNLVKLLEQGKDHFTLLQPF